ncbi:hypothetical protein OH76DRAFT_1253927 [Lentinus brumalis]|uniref:Uncharacterized protein n=1 Tax=Lentinus brumalis TaxID=2498619 RepID=A0A371CRH8_9APHY|nr:hypothetical protein OH76DRAFT_1253927 [Polyporus brumalis]
MHDQPNDRRHIQYTRMCGVHFGYAAHEESGSGKTATRHSPSFDIAQAPTHLTTRHSDRCRTHGALTAPAAGDGDEAATLRPSGRKKDVVACPPQSPIPYSCASEGKTLLRSCGDKVSRNGVRSESENAQLSCDTDVTGRAQRHELGRSSAFGHLEHVTLKIPIILRHGQDNACTEIEFARKRAGRASGS